MLTASSDKTARLWDVETGQCSQILEGHTDEIFSCAFNYEGNTIITGGSCGCTADSCRKNVYGTLGRGRSVVRAQDWRPRGPGFESRWRHIASELGNSFYVKFGSVFRMSH